MDFHSLLHPSLVLHIPVEKSLDALNHGADVNACDAAGWTLLFMRACLHGYVDIAEELLLYGANVNAQAKMVSCNHYYICSFN
jgi:hypothetical protein